jgi:hypothetical protein
VDESVVEVYNGIFEIVHQFFHESLISEAHRDGLETQIKDCLAVGLIQHS